jgi:hypothetical protein
VWMDLLFTLVAVAPLFPVTHTHLRSAESPVLKSPDDPPIPLLRLQAAPAAQPRQ